MKAFLTSLFIGLTFSAIISTEVGNAIVGDQNTFIFSQANLVLGDKNGLLYADRNIV
jgi:hypothetical protein